QFPAAGLCPTQLVAVQVQIRQRPEVGHLGVRRPLPALRPAGCLGIAQAEPRSAPRPEVSLPVPTFAEQARASVTLPLPSPALAVLAHGAHPSCAGSSGAEGGRDRRRSARANSRPARWA